MNILSTITQNFKNIVIIVLVIFAIIMLMKCNGEKNRNQALELAGKALQQKVAKAEAERLDGRKQFEDYKKDAEGKHILVTIEKQESDKKVQQQQRTIDRLAGIVRTAPVGGAISSGAGVLVTPEFKQACDSLPAQIDLLNLALADRDTAINGMIDLYSYEIQIRDEEIYKEMNYSDSLKSDFNRQTVLLKQAIKIGKPRGTFLLGVGILGNEKKFLGGASIKAAYLTKGGKMYMYSPHVMQLPGMGSPVVVHEASIFITIFK